MSLSANELNYLIWRYLQEGGLDVSAYALQRESKANEYESRLGSKVPLGCLVDLVQKGILYTKVNELIAKDGKTVPEDVVNLDFNLFGALDEENEQGLSNRQLLKDGQTIQIEQPKALLTSEPAVDSAETEDIGFTKVLQEFYEYPAGLCIDWNPSSALKLAWGQRDHNVGVCQLKGGIKLLPHPESSKDTVIVTWSPSGDLLVTASENGEVRLWDEDGAIRFIMALHRAPIVAIEWSPDGKHLLTLDAANIAIIWDVSTGQPVQHVGSAEKSVCLGTDACWIDEYKFVVPGPKYTLQVYQLGDVGEEPLGVLSGHVDTITTVSYNSQLKLLCSASDDRTIRIWKGNSTNSLQVLLGHSQPITYLGWKQTDGKWYLVSTSLDSTIRLWDFFKGEPIDVKVSENSLPILSATLSHTGDLATGDADGNVVVWNVTTEFKQVAYYQPRQPGSIIAAIEWSKDDKKIAVSYSDSPSVVINVE